MAQFFDSQCIILPTIFSIRTAYVYVASRMYCTENNVTSATRCSWTEMVKKVKNSLWSAGMDRYRIHVFKSGQISTVWQVSCAQIPNLILELITFKSISGIISQSAGTVSDDRSKLILISTQADLAARDINWQLSCFNPLKCSGVR